MPIRAAQHPGRVGVRSGVARSSQAAQPPDRLRRFPFGGGMAHPNGTNCCSQARDLRRFEFRAARRSGADPAAGALPRGRLHGPDAGHAALSPFRQRERLAR